MSQNQTELQKQLEAATITDLGHVALAIENLSDRIFRVAYGADAYPGALEKIAVELEKGADALGAVASAIGEQE